MNFKSGWAFGLFLMGSLRFIVSYIASVNAVGEVQLRALISSILGLAMIAVAILWDNHAQLNKEQGE